MIIGMGFLLSIATRKNLTRLIFDVMEGGIGMAITAFMCLLSVLFAMSELPTHVAVIMSLVIAPIASITELYTKGGWDTVTVPAVSALLLSVTLIW